MHEELYLNERPWIRIVFLAAGILLLPLSLLEAAVRGGEFSFSFFFNTPLLVCASLMLLPMTDQSGKNLKLYLYPFLSLLAFEFFRFGTVGLFNRSLPFDVYIISAMFMLAAFGYSFILYFISLGKMRSKLPLLIWSSFMLVLAALSAGIRTVPFFAYEEITEGRLCVGISNLAAFLVLNASGVALGVALRDDKTKEEARLLRQKKREERRNRRS